MLFNSELCVELVWTLCGKSMMGRRKALFWYFLFFGGALIIGGWGVVGLGGESCLDKVKIASFSNRDFSRINKHDTFWYVVSTGDFYVLILWAITVLDFRPLEIYKNLGLPSSNITFTVNSHANSHFYKYIWFICLKYYTIWNLFFFIKVRKSVYIPNRTYWFCWQC